MNLYSVKFSGYWPVGAVALVAADLPQDAVHRLRDADCFEPFADNPSNRDLFAHQVPGATVDGPLVLILLDGNY